MMLAVETILNNEKLSQLMFLSWESPWPAHSGADLRTVGLLREISKVFEVELIVLSRQSLSIKQTEFLSEYASKIIRIPLRDTSFQDKLRAAGLMLRLRYPYHSAVLDLSFRDYPDVLRRILSFPRIIYASFGHWGTLILNQQARNWILDQHNADVEFWRVYASQVSNPLLRLAALVNWWLSDKHFRCIYPRVGRIISVCEEDRQLTLTLAPTAKVDVIQNGVDCSYYYPERVARKDPPRLLFTGTSAARNMTALHKFMRDIFPFIQRKIPDVELLVGGNFHSKAQSQFSAYRGIRFTGRVDDIRPIFNQSDVYVAPFEETHGSKLKIAEAMAMGMAIVSTPEGIRGFPLVDGESVLVAHKKEQFAAHAVALLANPIRRERLGAAARKVALFMIDWKVLGKRLVQIINSVYEEISK